MHGFSDSEFLKEMKIVDSIPCLFFHTFEFEMDYSSKMKLLCGIGLSEFVCVYVRFAPEPLGCIIVFECVSARV